ncbi:iron ABC transporter permease [Nocardiopsis terrae]|uniref:Iron complex transport system permease protein n=1 Tax=Nocardiopsis terrae TaxID=372655 RepID=A0ABR9HI64_9ACTN|nr:iron ABC transporter permease [Nocardiopsis terrae]MBE1458722.1 iron complex transport system permease protein [Nocardiopsis terrae]GHC78863.1 iron ABC transporter permease [Nocardiopsis terrae]
MADRVAERPLSPAPAEPHRKPRPPSGGSGLLSGPGARSIGLMAALLVLAGALLASVLVGYQQLSVADVYIAYAGFTGSDTDLVVRHLRVPRTLAGLAVGAALGVSGVLVQGVTRNPLGDPGILGINAGAALAAVLAISVLGVSALLGYVAFAFLGAAAAACAVYAVGSLGPDGAGPVRLALAGAAISALLGSLTSAIILRDRASLDEYRFWVVGSLAGADGAALLQALPFLTAGLVLAVALARPLNAVALGDELARSLGTRLWLVRGASALAVVLLAGTATAAAGPIGFVGVAVPHIARALVGPDHRWVLPWSAVLAPVLLLVADVVGRVVARPEELQVGIVTALVGAPFFILLVRRRRAAGL